MGKIIDRKSHNRNKPKGGRTRVRKHEVKLSDFKKKPRLIDLLNKKILVEEPEYDNPLKLLSRKDLKHTSEENMDARIAHFEKTTKEQRSKDYQSNEPISKNLKQYLNNPTKYDWRGVDTSLPEGYKLYLGITDLGGMFYGKLTLYDTKTGKEAGHSGFYIEDYNGQLIIEKLQVNKGHRGKQLSSNIRRQVMLFADEYNLTVLTSAAGHSKNPFTDEELGDYYSSFGRKGHNYQNRPPHK